MVLHDSIQCEERGWRCMIPSRVRRGGPQRTQGWRTAMEHMGMEACKDAPAWFHPMCGERATRTHKDGGVQG